MGSQPVPSSEAALKDRRCELTLVRGKTVYIKTAPEADNEIGVAALALRNDWSGVFAVVERDRVRIRPLPSSVDRP